MVGLYPNLGRSYPTASPAVSRSRKRMANCANQAVEYILISRQNKKKNSNKYMNSSHFCNNIKANAIKVCWNRNDVQQPIKELNNNKHFAAAAGAGRWACFCIALRYHITTEATLSPVNYQEMLCAVKVIMNITSRLTSQRFVNF